MASRSRALRPHILTIGFVALAVVGWQYSPTELLVVVQQAKRHWPLAVLGLAGLYLVRPFFLWPLSVFSVFIGYLFGFPMGVPVVLLGTLLTCFPPFLVAAHVNGSTDFFERLAATGATVVDATGELRGMIAARLSPTPADAVSYGAGVAGVSSRAFAIGTLVGELPWAVFYLLLGESFRTFSTDAIRGVDVRLLAVAVVVAALLLSRPLYEFVSDRDGAADRPVS